MHHDNAHLYTALAYYVIGGVLMIIAHQVWQMHPLDRARLLGHYLTENGLRLLLKNWPFVFLFGMFIFSCALDHHAEWSTLNGLVVFTPRILGILAWTETGISVLTAASVLYVLFFSLLSNGKK